MCFACWLASRCGLLERVGIAGTLAQARRTLKPTQFQTETLPKIEAKLPSTQVALRAWGINTQAFHKVNVLMMSPNFWDGQQGIGNKHFFFMLEGCRNEAQARGFFNEFLKSELDPHRKVIEMVGAKMKTEKSEHQLSGLGFSSTQRNSVLCKVAGAFTRVIKIVF
jgi:hypothetical protein